MVSPPRSLTALMPNVPSLPAPGRQVGDDETTAIPLEAGIARIKNLEGLDAAGRAPDPHARASTMTHLTVP
jgi:hypothetical protein